MRYLIADIVMELITDRTEYISEDLKEFEYSGDRVSDCVINIRDYEEFKIDEHDNTLVDCKRIYVAENDNEYKLEYRNLPVSGCVISKDLKSAYIYLRWDDYLEYPLFCAIRDIFFFKVQERGMIAVHSSSIIYRDKAYVFSAPSGTGKTTHTNMWIQETDAQILDGDLCVLKREGRDVYAYGLPWAGSSRKFMNKKVKLGGIIFLVRSRKDVVRKPDVLNGILMLTARCFTPTFTADMVSKNTDVSASIGEVTDMYILECTKKKSAFLAVRAAIDEDFREENRN